MKIKQKRVSNSQREYIRGIIHNLSLQRWQDQEIADYLEKEKNITLSRSYVTQIRNRMERRAEKWYFELRESRYRYVAMFKERIDCLLSYQKKLHEIISSTYPDAEGEHEQRPEVKIKAISELHAIEVTLFTMWKALPNLYVNNSIAVNYVPISASEPATAEERGYDSTQIPPIDEIDERNRFDRWSIDSRPMSSKYIMEMKSKYGIRDGLWLADEFVQCPDCKRWFESESIRSNHTCITPAAVAATGRSNRWLPNDNSNNGKSVDREGEINYGIKR